MKLSGELNRFVFKSRKPKAFKHKKPQAYKSSIRRDFLATSFKNRLPANKQDDKSITHHKIKNKFFIIFYEKILLLPQNKVFYECKNVK